MPVRPGARPTRFLIHVLVLPALVLVTALAVGHSGLGAQVRPIYSRGAAGVLQQIQELTTTASALHVAAHPDDEDSAFIARVARGDHARVAYLSLNRGEGGQNVIGTELSDALGVIRTEELLQARTLDGGEQFFTRAFDYGFSKSIDEAARFWGEREVLGDMVRIIRTYRPLVIYSRFSGTPADGHGQHQLAGRLAPMAYKAAGDPAEFPEQIEDGLRPWQPLKLYRGVGFRPAPGNDPTTRIDTGRVDPLLGRSYFEIAAEGRSQHKSQEMGVPESRGRQETGLILLDAKVKTAPGETSAFAGIDTSLRGLAALAGLPAGALRTELDAAASAVEHAVDTFHPLQPERAVPNIARALSHLRAARKAVRGIAGATDAAIQEADFLLAIEEHDAELALQRAAGVVVDALSDEETVAPGESVSATVRLFLANPALASIEGVALKAPAGWAVASSPPAQPDSTNFMARYFRENADRTDAFTIGVPSDASLSQPYWLASPREKYMFDWPDQMKGGLPVAPPRLWAEVQAIIGGVPLTLKQPIQYRLIDQVRGELRRNVDVVPAVSVTLDSTLEVVPVASLGQPRRIAVRLQGNAKTALSGSLRLVAPSGWKVEPADAPFTTRAKGERLAAAFTVTPPRGVSPGSYALDAVATVDGRAYTQSTRTIAYPHIQTHRLYSPARAQVRVFDLSVAPVKVGYVMGSGDQVPDALRRMGLGVTLLDDDALASADLGVYDTIVVGVRASEARPAFVAANTRLLDYVKGGGTLVVQYQQTDYSARGLTPFPGQIGVRVTDETAPMTVLDPAHPVFTTPNRIGPSDFEHWVQERNLYAFSTFDANYTPLLETADPGEAPQRGGQLYARIGKGQYVYTAYAWFRQLPAGVPGAYRLFANLVSLGATTR
jgi:LmbE family N-acetylglucosaminyl deacetylase